MGDQPVDDNSTISDDGTSDMKSSDVSDYVCDGHQNKMKKAVKIECVYSFQLLHHAYP